MLDCLYIANKKTENIDEILDSMHKLRYEIFYKELGWRDGLTIVDNKEYDGYDNEHSHYLIHFDNKQNVDFFTRLAPSNTPHMYSNEYFAPSFKYMSFPENTKIWSWSRSGASKELRNKYRGRLYLSLIKGVLEFGVQNKIEGYFGTLCRSAKPKFEKFGFKPFLIGIPLKSQAEDNLPFFFPINSEIKEIVTRKNQLQEDKEWLKYLY